MPLAEYGKDKVKANRELKRKGGKYFDFRGCFCTCFIGPKALPSSEEVGFFSRSGGGQRQDFQCGR
jgi:hypothetical protein